MTLVEDEARPRGVGITQEQGLLAVTLWTAESLRGRDRDRRARPGRARLNMPEEDGCRSFATSRAGYVPSYAEGDRKPIDRVVGLDSAPDDYIAKPANSGN